MLTTNFDRLIEIAYERLNPGDWPPLTVAIDDEDFPSDLSAAHAPTLWKLHGSLSRDGVSTLHSVRATVASILAGGARRPALDFLARALGTHDLLVLGYSGWDDLDIVPVLADTPSHQQLLWVDHADVGQPAVRHAPEMIAGLGWERDTVGRQRIWFTVGPEGETIRDPSTALSITVRTADVMSALAIFFGLRADYPVDPDPGPFDRTRYFGEWRVGRAAERSGPYAFFLELTEARAFRADIAAQRERWRARMHELRAAPEASPGERLAVLFDRASEALCAMSHDSKRRRQHDRETIALRRELVAARASLSTAETVTALGFLARFAYLEGEPNRGDTLFTEALNLAEKDRDLAGQLKTIEVWLAAEEWASSNGIRRDYRAGFVFDPRVTYEYQEALRVRLGHQPSRWLEDVAGGVAEVDDIHWQVERLHRIARHAVDIGDVISEARAGEKLGRIYYARTLECAESLPRRPWFGREPLDTPIQQEMRYHLVLALEESFRVQELGRIVNLRVLEEPEQLASRIESCKSRLGSRLNPKLLEKLKESIWR